MLHLSRPTVINLIRECSEDGLIEKSGFKKCGIIHVRDGSPRIAYHWTAR